MSAPLPIGSPSGSSSVPSRGAAWCRQGGTVAVVGGGPAGAFFAIQALRKAREMGISLRMTLIERQWGVGRAGAEGQGQWSGCNHCAGGLSSRLVDVLETMGLTLPDGVVQSEIRRVTIQGYWKNIELEVPAGRRLVSVYRGSRPSGRPAGDLGFDWFLLEQARLEGAEVVGGEVRDIDRTDAGPLRISFSRGGSEETLQADFVVFAAGRNAGACAGAARNGMAALLRKVIPGYREPRSRPALIFELEAKPALPPSLEGQIHFVEYGSRSLRLEMTSLVPKRGFVTVVLAGPSVDGAAGPAANHEIMRQFLELPHIRKLIPNQCGLGVACACKPAMVVKTAEQPLGDRVAAIGDMATARLYKDGILSAYLTATALAETILTRGIDRPSLQAGYGPVIRQFKRDNRFAAVVFLVHRILFSSSLLSRILYQAVLTERKNRLRHERRLEQILWLIASGDDAYGSILRAMFHPATVWSILKGGLLVTVRNLGAELFFGLRWRGFGRFTTGVAKEQLDAKRVAFATLLAEAGIEPPVGLEFERMYTIRLFVPADRAMDQLGRFGEAERRYLRPRWIRIRRVAGSPNQPGCTIRYFVVTRHLSFGLVLERRDGDRLAVYRVVDGFARGGVLIFEVESRPNHSCDLSIYVAFSFPRGRRWWTRPFWRAFRWLFPAFVHDVIWNHSLCTLKDVVETEYQGQEATPWQPSSPPAAIARSHDLAPS